MHHRWRLDRHGIHVTLRATSSSNCRSLARVQLQFMGNIASGERNASDTGYRRLPRYHTHRSLTKLHGQTTSPIRTGETLRSRSNVSLDPCSQPEWSSSISSRSCSPSHLVWPTRWSSTPFSSSFSFHSWTVSWSSCTSPTWVPPSQQFSSPFFSSWMLSGGTSRLTFLIWSPTCSSSSSPPSTSFSVSSEPVSAVLPWHRRSRAR